MDYEDWTATETLGGRYVLLAPIGSGQTTTVFTADDLRLERRVAVKLFHDLPDEDSLNRFAVEAQVLAGLSHPGLVTVYDVNLDTHRPYIVMRLIDGGKLSDHVHHDTLAPPAVARLGAQLADVLAYVHERGVVHGDINARNVLVDKQGNGHLTGFGVDLGLGRPSGDIEELGLTLAECLPYDLGPEWRAVLGGMTDENPDERPDAVRCGELLRNIESGSTSEFALPVLNFDPTDPSDPDDPAEPPPALAEPRAKKRMRPVAYTGLAGMGLAVTALAVVLATVTTGGLGQPSGEQRQPQVEQPSDGTYIQPPGQSYPQAPEERGNDARAREQTKPDRSPSRTATSPPSSSAGTTTTTPPPEDDQGDNNGPGNGNGNGQDNGRHKSLLEIILGL